ncbi:MAG: DMT family transporter [Rhodococcus sp. (in: high G+C Gram-positive bacteria)]
MKVGLDGLSFVQVVLARLVLGALTLAVLLRLMHVRLPRRGKVWAHSCVLAVFQCIVPWLLFAWAEQEVDSATASIFNATTPLMTTVLAFVVLPTERPTALRSAGLVLGFIGILVVFAPWADGLSGSVGAQLACLGATTSYGVALVYLRRFVIPLGVPSLAVAALQIGIAAALMLVATPVVALDSVSLTLPVVASMVALGCAGTGLAFLWNTNVVTGWGPSAASTVTYLSPVVGIVLGAAVLGEAVTWNAVAGTALIIVGVLATTRRRQTSAPPLPPESIVTR